VSTTLHSVPTAREAPRAGADELATPEQLKAAAAQRRKERKAARAHAAAPDRDHAFDALSLDDLRAMRTALAQEETRVSYWRRIIQARLDVVRAGGVEGDRVAGLGRVLADAPTLGRRLAHITVGPVDEVPPLPDLSELWARQADDDPAARARLAQELVVAERRLSAVRAGLFHRIDAVTGELIARYRQDPRLALTALPHDPMPHPG
jgi:hypothetical protein